MHITSDNRTPAHGASLTPPASRTTVHTTAHPGAQSSAPVPRREIDVSQLPAVSRHALYENFHAFRASGITLTQGTAAQDGASTSRAARQAPRSIEVSQLPTEQQHALYEMFHALRASGISLTQDGKPLGLQPSASATPTAAAQTPSGMPAQSSSSASAHDVRPSATPVVPAHLVRVPSFGDWAQGTSAAGTSDGARPAAAAIRRGPVPHPAQQGPLIREIDVSRTPEDQRVALYEMFHALRASGVHLKGA